MDLVDIVHGLSGYFPWSEWTLFMDSVDNVHGLSGHFPRIQWTLSMDLRFNTPAGQCPLSPWTFYRQDAPKLGELRTDTGRVF